MKRSLFVITCVLLYIGSALDLEYDEEIKKMAQESLNQFEKDDKEEWKSKLDQDVHIESMGNVYNIDDYLSALDIESVETEIMTPITSQHGFAVFVKKMKGTFKSGCDFEVENVIHLIHFNADNKIDKWIEHLPIDFNLQQECFKLEL